MSRSLHLSDAESGDFPALISLQHGDPFLTEKVGHLGFDGVVVDMERGNLDFETAYLMLTALAASPSTPMVRLPGIDPALAMKVLDAGALAVVCPGVESADAAAEFAEACKYPPLGYRSLGPNRAGIKPNYSTGANAVVQALVALSSKLAYTRLEEILAVEHLDGVVLEGSTAQIGAHLERAIASGKRVLASVDSWPLDDVVLPPCAVIVQDAAIYRGSFEAAVDRLNRAARGSDA